MCQTVSLGTQDFAYIRENNCFLVDKTDFIREWWENKDAVTLITRPRRFGKSTESEHDGVFLFCLIQKQR